MSVFCTHSVYFLILYGILSSVVTDLAKVPFGYSVYVMNFYIIIKLL